MSDKQYLLGSDEHQAWMKDYFFAPRGIGFSEPGVVGLDSKEFSAYNVAKSFYQTYPAVFNLKYISEEVGISTDEAKKRLKRMYDEHLIMFVMNPAVAVYGWGLYYWVVKFKEGTDPSVKEKLSNWFQNKDDICTGYEAEGDFDYFNGNHMRVLDNLLTDVIGPFKNMKEVEYVHLCPIRRDVRESNVNMWDAPGDGYRKFIWPQEQLDKLVNIQDKLDATDLNIIKAINGTTSVSDMLDYDVLANLSGLDADQMKKDFSEICDNRRFIVPMIFVNYMKLGLTKKMYLVRLFQNVPCYRKAQIVDMLSYNDNYCDIWEFSDSFYDIMLCAFEELCDVEKLKIDLESIAEIEDIKEASSKRQFRRWVARLDEQNGFWEECVFTDDFLQDRTAPDYKCCKVSIEEE
ncbi:AsnC family transcriptional regulator [Candidatus Epulonipiscium fishelsonii]|uniref:AsnC family transcriptional regulator n=1 Tax=Candidatus Epulonipiscium fishelsonii TaxID=77094 RepID=A0ACC8XCG9_9FIRM|nr:AsnC family transcriptional regulator [Epulopiscium sp. SCG-B11WGA-EpuloA1]ONI43209.1 AsnC family transcriptional regulator [Epulopiscium sp. SCG-B05WGA-EpuloA1]